MSEIIEFEGQQWESAEERPPLKNEIYLCRQCTERGPHPLRNMGDGYKSAEIILRPVSAPPQPPARCKFPNSDGECEMLADHPIHNRKKWSDAHDFQAAEQAGEPGEARPKPFDSGFLAGIEFGFRQGEKGNNLEFALAEGSKLIADERARWESKS